MSAEGDHKGCRTQHMPWADGTTCGNGMVSYNDKRTLTKDISTFNVFS